MDTLLKMDQSLTEKEKQIEGERNYWHVMQYRAM